MKVILTTTAMACALPLLTVSNHAQAGGAGASGSSGAGAASGGSVITGGSARGSAINATPSGAIAPTGNLGAPANARVGTAPSTPAGTTPTTSAVIPGGPLNPGGITATPPGTVGRTFQRTTIGGGPTDAIIDPAANQPVFQFPPASTPAAPGVATNTPTLSGNTFPGGPVSVGNTVGTNFSRGTITPFPREPVAVNLPPGARIVTNAFGVSEAVVPGPVIVPTNSVGRGPTFESASDRTREVPQRSLPPRNPSIVQP